MNRHDYVSAHQQADQDLCSHRSGDPAASERLIAAYFNLLSLVAHAAECEGFGSPGQGVPYDPEFHQPLDDSPARGQTVYVVMSGFLEWSRPIDFGLHPQKPMLVVRAGVSVNHPFGDVGGQDLPSSILDVRVPQPGREADYGVPLWAAACAGSIYSLRNEVPDDFVARLDEILLALYRPWIRKRE